MAFDLEQDRLEASSSFPALRAAAAPAAAAAGAALPDCVRDFYSAFQKWAKARAKEKKCYRYDYVKEQATKAERAARAAVDAAYRKSTDAVDCHLPSAMNALGYAVGAAARDGDCFLTSVNVAARVVPAHDGAVGSAQATQHATGLRQRAVNLVNEDYLHGEESDVWLDRELDGATQDALVEAATEGHWETAEPDAAAVFQHLVAMAIGRPIAVVYRTEAHGWGLRVFGDRDDANPAQPRKMRKSHEVHAWYDYNEKRATLRPALRRVARANGVFLKYNGLDHYAPVHPSSASSAAAAAGPSDGGDDDDRRPDDDADDHADDEGDADAGAGPSAGLRKRAPKAKRRRQERRSDGGGGASGASGDESDESDGTAPPPRRTRNARRTCARQADQRRVARNRARGGLSANVSASDPSSQSEADSTREPESEPESNARIRRAAQVRVRARARRQHRGKQRPARADHGEQRRRRAPAAPAGAAAAVAARVAAAAGAGAAPAAAAAAAPRRARPCGRSAWAPARRRRQRAEPTASTSSRWRPRPRPPR